MVAWIFWSWMLVKTTRPSSHCTGLVMYMYLDHPSYRLRHAMLSWLVFCPPIPSRSRPDNRKLTESESFWMECSLSLHFRAQLIKHFNHFGPIARLACGLRKIPTWSWFQRLFVGIRYGRDRLTVHDYRVWLQSIVSEHNMITKRDKSVITECDHRLWSQLGMNTNHDNRAWS